MARGILGTTSEASVEIEYQNYMAVRDAHLKTRNAHFSARRIPGELAANNRPSALARLFWFWPRSGRAMRVQQQQPADEDDIFGWMDDDEEEGGDVRSRFLCWGRMKFD